MLLRILPRTGQLPLSHHTPKNYQVRTSVVPKLRNPELEALGYLRTLTNQVLEMRSPRRSTNATQVGALDSTVLLKPHTYQAAPPSPSASPRKLLEKQIPRPHPSLAESKPLEVELGNLRFNKPSG